MPSSPIARAVVALALAAAALAQRPLARFTNLNHSFELELPQGFRQLAPLEAGRLARDPATPAELRTTSPHAFYAVGEVDRWLAGHVESPWLYVMEQDEEWHVDGDFAAQLAELWQKAGSGDGRRHVVTDVAEAKVGPSAHAVHTALRTTTPADGRAVKHLDVYAPTGGAMVTLCFSAWAEDFDRWRPEFDRWLATLTFARPARGQQKLSDRLWTPLLTGGLVALVLIGLYRHNRRSR